MTAPAPGPHEHLAGVPRLCDGCWEPIPWGDLRWRLIADVPAPAWTCWHTGCLTATNEGDQP